VVVAVRLVVLGISQPPSAAVFSPPRILLRCATLHRVLRAASTTVGGTGHVNNKVRLLRVVVDGLAHFVVHKSPIVLIARRPNLPFVRARIRLSAPPDPSAVMDLHQATGRVTVYIYSRDLAVACATRSTFQGFQRRLAQVLR